MCLAAFMARLGGLGKGNHEETLFRSLGVSLGKLGVSLQGEEFISHQEN